MSSLTSHCRNSTPTMVDDGDNTSDCRTRIQELLFDENAFRRCRDQVVLESCSHPYQTLLWRDRVAQWYFDVIDHLNVPREIVFLAMNFLDRAVAADGMGTAVNKDEYELKSTTCLFLAIRVSSKADLKISDLLQLSQSRLQVKDVQAAGTRLLRVLSLKTPLVNPTSFAKSFLRLIQSSISLEDSSFLMEMTCYLMELSACDHIFISVPPSKLAFAAVAVCLASEHVIARVGPQTRDSFIDSLEEETSLSLESSEIRPIFDRLSTLFNQSEVGVTATKNAPNIVLDDSDDNESCTKHDSTESLISLLPWTSTVSDLSAFPQVKSCKRARLR